MADETNGTTTAPPAPPVPAPASPDALCPDCGHERFQGWIAIGCVFGLLFIAIFSCYGTPAYWPAVNAIVTFFSVQVASFMGYRQGLSRRQGDASAPVAPATP